MFDKLFENYKFDFDKLLEFGFIKEQERFCYFQKILKGAFELRVFIDESGQLSWEVWDLDVNEIYPLVKISTVSGAFVGKIRLEIEEIFKEIIEKCGKETVFKSAYAHLVEKYIDEKYGDKFEYLWSKFPNNAVFRRKDNKKWYGAILTVAKNKLGLIGEDKIEVLNLRGSFDEIQQIVDGKGYFLGYHMNKKSWFSIRLNGVVDINEIYHRIDESYILAQK